MQLPGCGQELPLHPRNSAGQQRVGVTDPRGRSLGLKIRDWPSQSISPLLGRSQGRKSGARRGGPPQECRLLQAVARQPGKGEGKGGSVPSSARAPGGSGAQSSSSSASPRGQRRSMAPAGTWDLGPDGWARSRGTGQARRAKRGWGRGQHGGGASTSPGSPS